MSRFVARLPARFAAPLIVALVATSALVVPVAAAEGLTMAASGYLAGHVRPGSWMAIEVSLKNDGPPVTGELRMAGGNASKTRFGVVVDLPTGSDKRYVLYAQPPAFGRDLDVALASGGQIVTTAKVAYQLHDATQTLIGVVAEDPAALISRLDLPTDQNRQAPVIVRLDPETLPDRIEGWAPLDRLVWQDVDGARLTPLQIEALRGWLAGGGRLVIVGGTAGPGLLSAFPDNLLPFRPTSTVDVAPDNLAPLVGRIPDGATTIPALSGVLTTGRVLADGGGRAIAAEMAFGSGNVTIIGVDPTIPWIADGFAATGQWQRLLPPRSTSGPSIADDSQILTAVASVPSLALPPVGGLLALLVGYIVLVGPINYLVLRRIDRREWAWVTIPAFIVVFAAGAFFYGSFLRGSDVLIHEVAIVRGAAGTTEGLAQAYYGIFSPSRGVYQVRVPGGALLSSPVNGDFFGSPAGSAGVLDILQGDPSSVRDLAVAIGGFRIVRAESPVDAPALDVRIRLQDGKLVGEIRNDSSRTVEDAAVILGATIARIGDIPAGETRSIVATAIDATGCCQPLADRLVGQPFAGIAAPTDTSRRTSIRYAMVNQLTWDPNRGGDWMLPSDGPVVIGWGSDPVLPLQVDGHDARRTSDVLYYVPARLEISGITRFRNDLMRSTVVESDALFFGKDPWSIGFGRGTMILAYRPLPFAGILTPKRLVVGPNVGIEFPIGAVTEVVSPIGPAADQGPSGCDAPPCAEPSPDPSPDPSLEPIPPENFDGLPEIELLDVTSGTWMGFPHLSSRLYEVEDGARYVDPATGQVLVRFRNEISDNVNFSFLLEMEADIR
ncbi:MAG TPA: hypothetical protein VJZ72_10465 [Candidatus Limnocylindrales bacterium]|nr:hypothetical protein [Candidatus Limnocylindrales bacterium]